jgi:hypothetical protein
VDSEATEAFFAQGEAMQSCSSECFTLHFTVIMGWYQPDVPDRFQCHAVAIVFHNDRRVSSLEALQRNSYTFRVSIIAIFYQLEYRQSWRPDQLIAKKLQQPCSWPKG